MNPLNNCTSPLKIVLGSGMMQGYKCSKGGDQSGLYVDKEVANELLLALQEAKTHFTQENMPVLWKQINTAIANATKES